MCVFLQNIGLAVALICVIPFEFGARFGWFVNYSFGTHEKNSFVTYFVELSLLHTAPALIRGAFCPIFFSQIHFLNQ